MIDDGGRFEFEMWRYAKALKQPRADAELPFSHRPNGRAHIMGADVAINSLGLRDDREISPEKAAGTTRILMLGDSVTFGFGVAGSETTAQQLEALLKSERPAARIEVLNAGVGNYNTSMEVAAYFQFWRALAPDIVLLNFFVNDAEPTPVPRGNLLTRYSLAAVYFGSRVDAVSRMTNGAPGWQDYYGGLFDDQQPGWQKAKAAIAALKAACDSDQRPLAIVNYPDLHQTRPYPLTAITTKVSQLADGLSIPFLDLTPEVTDQENAALLWVNGGDPHPNGATNTRYARRIATWLLTRWLAEQRNSR
ncbi:MAG: SGNH/GDSL hydrolase family protein [Cyanobacteria bacterium]|nr:SGNH/GDSL hydrolase family protein [Cyanobacteriota bacterium]